LHYASIRLISYQNLLRHIETDHPNKFTWIDHRAHGLSASNPGRFVSASDYINDPSNSARGMSKISSFKRDWDGEPPVPSSSQVEPQTAKTDGPDPVSSATSSAPKPGGNKRLATIMAALQAAGLENKASGKMSVASSSAGSQSTTSSSAGSTASWVTSVAASSVTSEAQSTTSAAGKRSREEYAQASSKKQRNNRGIDSTGVQMSLIVTNKSELENRLVGTSKENLVMTLSFEQSQILQLVKEGKNIFFTGSAGTFALF
jgi:hypothetical protein